MTKHLLIALGLVGALVFASPANAVFLPAFTGNSEAVVEEGDVFPPSTVPSSDGIINFAVYDNTNGGDWTMELGVDANEMPLTVVGAAPDTTAPYVFFYQLVNSNPFDPEDELTELQIERGIFTGGGFLTDAAGTPLVFDEAVGGATGGLANPSINPATGPAVVVGDNTVGAGNIDPIPSNHVPGFVGGILDATPFATDASAIIPDAFNLLARFYEFEFPGLPGFGSAAAGGTLTHSVVVYLTSELPPLYLMGRMHDGDNADGDVPSTAPELGTFGMTFAALISGMVAVMGARRKIA